jgi:hypothetical protein
VTNGYGLPVGNVSVIFRVPAELSFNASTNADPDTACSGFCTATEEAPWNLGTIAAGANQVITVNATVVGSLNDGTLIVTPIRVIADAMEDTINLQHITVIEN